MLKRHYISAEIDEKYYGMVLDRLKSGGIDTRYKLRLRQYEVKNIEAQLMLLEQQKEYLTSKKS